MSGSNLVTRWWHLSKSAILFGNQWTNRVKNQEMVQNQLSCFSVYLQNVKCTTGKQRKGVTFDFFGGFHILCVPLDGADESADVWEVHLTADQVLQALHAVPGLSLWSRLQVTNLSFERLKNNQHAEMCRSSYVAQYWMWRGGYSGCGFCIFASLTLH